MASSRVILIDLTELMVRSGAHSMPWVRDSYPHFEAAGLAQVTVERTAKAFQVGETNPMVGLEGRTSLLFNLSGALKASPQFFGEDGRPGNMIGVSTHTQI